MHALKAGSSLRSCAGTQIRSIALPRHYRVQRHSDLVRLPIAVQANPDDDKQPQQEEQQQDKGPGTLSNRYAKMVEELQKAGLTPAKAKVCGLQQSAPRRHHPLLTSHLSRSMLQLPAR
jgi:hypothetical protein